MKQNLRVSVSFLICTILGCTVWALFYPGTFSVDSLFAYNEALIGRFTDARPPLIAFMLFLFTRLGGTIGLFTLLECLLGYFGVRGLLLALTDFLGASRKKQEGITLAGLLLLSSPLSPMPIYFVTLWFDSWLAIFLLWTISFMLALLKNGRVEISRGDIAKIVITIFFILLVMLVRWNSAILYPFLILLMCSILSRRLVSRRMLLLLAMSPLAAYFLFLFFEYKVVRVEARHPENVSFALDLASMIVYDPSICTTLKLQSCELVNEKITPEFMVGNGAIDHTINQGLRTMEPVFMSLVNSESLTSDLLHAAMRFPEMYARVKVLNFIDYMTPRPRYYFQSFIHPNELGLYLNAQFKTIRGKYVVLLHWFYSHPVLKMFSFAHITWMVIDLVGILYCFVRHRHSDRYTILGLILLIPLAYELSYLLALTASDFRFMYPSTLLTQIITISAVAGWRGHPIQMPKDRHLPMSPKKLH